MWNLNSGDREMPGRGPGRGITPLSSKGSGGNAPATPSDYGFAFRPAR